MCLVLESSAKWPNDLNAIKRVKAAFHLQMADELRRRYQLKVKVNVDSFDVLKGETLGNISMSFSIAFIGGTTFRRLPIPLSNCDSP